MVWQAEGRFHAPPPVAADFPVLSLTHRGRRPLAERWRVDKLEVTPSVEEKGERPHPVPNVARWLGHLYQLCAEGEIDVAIDLVLDALDELLFREDERCCNDILRAADVNQLEVEVVLALLMETFRARRALAEREGLYRRIEEKLTREVPERVEPLLRGLR
jgi:hypothetical protein